MLSRRMLAAALHQAGEIMGQSGQRLAIHTVTRALPLGAVDDQTGGHQHFQVLRHSRLRKPHMFDDILAMTYITAGKMPQNLDPGRM